MDANNVRPKHGHVSAPRKEERTAEGHSGKTFFFSNGKLKFLDRVYFDWLQFTTIERHSEKLK